MADLTAKQQKFVDAYLGEANGNGVKAAQLAGYEGSYSTLGVTAHDNLKNPKIKAALEERFKQNCMGSDEVLARLADQARGAGAYLETGGSDYGPLVNARRLIEDGKGHLIKSVKYTDKGQPCIEFYDAQAALRDIGRFWKLFTDKMEHGGEIGIRNLGDLSDDDLDRCISEGVKGRTLTATVEE